MWKKVKEQEKKTQGRNEFVSNENPENIKNDLIMLKLKGYIDQKDFKTKNVELKQLPKKVQVGTVI